MADSKLHAKDTVEYLKLYQQGTSPDNIVIADNMKEGTFAAIKQIHEFNPDDKQIADLLDWWKKKMK